MDEVRFAIFDQSGVIVATMNGLMTQWNIRSTTYASVAAGP